MTNHNRLQASATLCREVCREVWREYNVCWVFYGNLSTVVMPGGFVTFQGHGDQHSHLSLLKIASGFKLHVCAVSHNV